MHPASVFHESDHRVLVERLRAHPFCTVVAVGDGKPYMTHTPVIADGAASLRFHVARANPICRALAEGRALISTLGPHAYVDPAWYEAPDHVGTWNYLSVEAEGRVQRLDGDKTIAFLHDLAAAFDPDPWTSESVDPKIFAKLLVGIEAYRLVPDRFEGTTKLSQNKPPELRSRVAKQLGDHPIAAAMGALVED